MDLLLPKLAKVIHNFSQFALQTKEYVTGAECHFHSQNEGSTDRLAAFQRSATPISSLPSSSLSAAVRHNGYRIL